MRTFNSDFLWCALLLLSLILLHISRRKTKIVNLNNRIFRDIVVIGLLDVVFELASNGFIARCADSICIGAGHHDACVLSVSGASALLAALLHPGTD